MKRKIVAIVIFAATLAGIPAGTFAYGQISSSPYTDTYYGELLPMISKLKNTEGKKIILVGNSNVAFGVNSSLLSEKLKEEGQDYTVCNFGLYGSIGTKAMMELSLPYIHSGDIVLFIPELCEQSMSLYFSSMDVYRSLDTKLSYINALDSDDVQKMVGSYASYVSEKYEKNHEKATPITTVYARSSFDDNGDLTQFERNQNIMADGVDTNDLITFDKSLLNQDFMDYVNEYFAKVYRKGAEMFWSFSPMNKDAVTADKATIDDFCDELQDKINFPLLSNPHHYVMEKNWFYDTNFHLNASGMIYRTRLLLDDLNNEFGITKANPIEIPEMPSLPEKEVIAEGNNQDVDCFIYGENAGNYKITGLSEAGKSRTELVIPVTYGGRSVVSFDKSVFENDEYLTKLTIQTNIASIPDYAFQGCSSLTGIYFEHSSPSEINIGYHLLDGADNAELYVKSEVKREFTLDYTWGYYASKIKAY